MELISARLRLAGVVLLTLIAASCTEKLDNSAGCPILCSGQASQIETVTLDAVSLDSTVSALAGQGTETSLLLATRGDTLDARAIIRFDSLPATFTHAGVDNTPTDITQVDSAFLRVIVDTVGAKLPGPLTLDVYDVNSDAPDSAIDAVAALFTPDRLVTSATFEKTALKDTVNIPIPPAQILAHKGGAMRLGIRARGPQSVQLRIVSTEGAGATLLSFRATPDTTVAKVQLFPYSKTPLNQPILANSLADYTLLVKGTATGPLNMLNVGGLPPRRVYMRFDIPSFILDSVDVIRATLLLTQQANNAIDPNDTILVVPQFSLAASAVTDVAKAAQITGVANTDTLRITPGGSGLRQIEVASVISVWKTQLVADTPRALVLLTNLEGTSPLEARFFSAEAAPGLRPQLRISYSLRKQTGLP